LYYLILSHVEDKEVFSDPRKVICNLHLSELLQTFIVPFHCYYFEVRDYDCSIKAISIASNLPEIRKTSF